MTLRFGFYSSVNGDRAYDAKDISLIFDGFVSDGVYPSLGDSLRVTPGVGRQVLVGTGRARFNGIWTYNDAPIAVPIDAPDPSNPRWDVIVLEVNMNDNIRANSIKVLKGIPSAAPQIPYTGVVPPVFQYPLANVLVQPGAASFVPGNISDQIGTATTPFAAFSKAASTVEVAEGESSVLTVSAKNLKDSAMMPTALPDGVGKTLVANANRWNAYTMSGGWVIDYATWSPYGTIKTKSLPVSAVTMRNGSSDNSGFLMADVSCTTTGMYYPYLNAIMESSAGKEITQLLATVIGKFTVNHLSLNHVAASNRYIHTVDVAPQVKIEADRTGQIYPGDRICFMQDGILKHFIVLKVEPLIEGGVPKTVLTLFRGISSENPDKSVYLSSSTIGNPLFSHDCNPITFPLSSVEWRVPWRAAALISTGFMGIEGPSMLSYIGTSPSYQHRWSIPPGSWRLTGKFHCAVINGTAANFVTYYGLGPEMVGNGNIFCDILDSLKWSTANHTAATRGIITYMLDRHFDTDGGELGLGASCDMATGQIMPRINYDLQLGGSPDQTQVLRSDFCFESLYI